jgi:hypothetical protein
MKIIEYQQLLSVNLSATRCSVADESVLSDIAGKIHAMAAAYESDGLTFCASGDLVNAMASFWYAFGWLHFGISYGIFTSPGKGACPDPGSNQRLPQESGEALDEKTRRYQRLLKTARTSVTCSPERQTVAGEFSDRIIFITGIFEQQGGRYILSGRNEDALACFSYGHGWLDAGVTAGLFRITRERDLFTV